MRLIFLGFALVSAGADRSAGASPLDTLVAQGVIAAGGAAAIAGTIDGETLRLVDGRELRLAGIGVPLSAPAVADEARQALAALADQHEAQIYYEERRNDRYGRIVAHLVISPDLWLEAELVGRGLARVETTRDTAAAAADLLAIEAAARAARRGLWMLRDYRVRDAGELGRWRDSFQIVAGRIAAGHKSPGRMWLEFAGARGRALELEIPSAANRPFRAAGLDPSSLIGVDVRVRGWLRWQDGPIIEVDHPAQIELIGASADAKTGKRR
ncbi:MAG: thermonuclease family protein [Alphaproteobacteria bacterium]|nr:thermonuclease family protein [Alphaproteobacteria bacterium]